MRETSTVRTKGNRHIFKCVFIGLNVFDILLSMKQTE